MARNMERRCGLMERYVDVVRGYLGTKRDIDKLVYRIVGTVYRAVTNKRITWEQGIDKIENLKTKEELSNEI